jgi:hypothetical protein
MRLRARVWDVWADVAALREQPQPPLLTPRAAAAELRRARGARAPLGRSFVSIAGLLAQGHALFLRKLTPSSSEALESFALLGERGSCDGNQDGRLPAALLGRASAAVLAALHDGATA